MVTIDRKKLSKDFYQKKRQEEIKADRHIPLQEIAISLGMNRATLHRLLIGVNRDDYRKNKVASGLDKVASVCRYIGQPVDAYIIKDEEGINLV